MEPYTEDDVRAGNVKPEFHTEMINNFSRAMEVCPERQDLICKSVESSHS